MRGFWITVAMAVLAAAFMLAAGGCATVPSVKTICPPMRQYTQAEQKALSDAVTALDVASPLIGAMEDYGALRDAVRACRK